ncbi:MAG: oxygen-insensitive NAD(P)H nitroreductase [Bdellovibrionales bacterium]
MDIEQIVKLRYTTKVFDPTRKISPQVMAQIETLLRLSPSSTNSQPWHFVVASTEEGKARVAKAAGGRYAFNGEKIANASHVVVLCARAEMDEAYLLKLLDQESRDCRFADEQSRDGQHQGRSYFVNRHRFELRDVAHWTEKQVYLALGFLLMGAAALGVDACPIEGFDQVVLAEELGLREKGMNPSVIVALGYRGEADFNAHLPKSRFGQDEVVTEI